MPFIKRNSAGEIVSASNDPLEDNDEEINHDAPELKTFLANLSGECSVFESSDMKMIRAIEDVIDLLIVKNVISITDLPAAVQHKLLERRSLRHSLNALNLLGEDDQGIY